MKNIVVLLAALFLLACQVAYLLPSPSPTPRATPTRTRVPVAVVPTPLPAPPTPTALSVIATAKDNVRVRAAPSTSAAILDRLNRGDSAQIVGRTAASDWLQIVMPNNPAARGWVAADFVTTNGSVQFVPVTFGLPFSPGGAAIPTPPGYP